MLHILNVWELWHTSDIQFCEMLLKHNKFIPPALSYYTKCQYNYPNTQDLLFFHSLISQYTLLVWPLRSRDWWHDRSMKSPCKSRATPQATRKNEDEAEGNAMSCGPNFITGLVYNYMWANWMSKMSEHPWSNRLHPCIWQTQLCQYFSRRTTCSRSSSRRMYRERPPSGQQKPITVPSSAEQSWTYLPRCIQ